ncbi:hypothetical protein ABW20_dc0110432 [Dactylellina cionopaga]|nr:hypothetical protein ABW20_dc0110432 [Dactylellina cionopaga]
MFLPCGHFYTVSTFDGIAHMKDFFEFESTEGWKLSGRYMQEKSSPELPKCPKCRQPFTTSARYNEVVKKAQLQNSIRQFTASSNNRLMSLIKGLTLLEDDLEASRDAFIIKDQNAIGQRYQPLQKLQKAIRTYNKKVLEEEQPYHRVYELATVACRKHNIGQEDYNPSVVQYRFGIEGAYQELRATLLHISDLNILVGRTDTPAEIKKKVWHDVGLAAKKTIPKCEKLIEACRARRFQRIEVQSRIAKAKFTILVERNKDELKAGKSNISASSFETLKDATLKDLDECLDICSTIESCRQYTKAVEEVIRCLRGSLFYSTVTDKEMKAVYDAMTREFGGTGHWYMCPNGHAVCILPSRLY